MWGERFSFHSFIGDVKFIVESLIICAFCLQYLTIKVCNDKPLSINFAVLNFGIINRVQRINKLNTNKQKQRQRLWKVELGRL